MAQIRTRKRGKTYSYIFEVGKIDGKRKVVEKGGFLTKDAAYKAGVEAYTDYLHGNIGITSESITLKDFMTQWLENSVAHDVKETTLQNYRSYFVHHIEPHLGAVKVQDLTPAMLEKWIRKLQKSGLAFTTIAGIHSLLKQALNFAVQPSQLISSNPAIYIKVPKNAPRNIIKRQIIRLERFNALLEKYPFGTPLYIPLLLLYHTGMRVGEVLGLTWSDIDFNSKSIKISRQVVYIFGKRDCLTTPKTESSCRIIYVDDFLLGELARWKEQQAANENKFGARYVYIYCNEQNQIIIQSKLLPLDLERMEFVCTREKGQPLQKKFLGKYLLKEGLNAHSFRHTHATQLIESGANAKGVAGRLGHSSVTITQNLYAHNTQKLQLETAAIFAQNLQTKPQCRQIADKILYG